MGQQFSETMKCRISNWGCIYHACMSDDCQKRYMLENGGDFGPGRCASDGEEDNKVTGKINDITSF
jgi:hypothetical protein